MTRARLHPRANRLGARARLAVIVALGAIVLLGALAPTTAGATTSASDHADDHSAVAIQHDAIVATIAANPAPSHRLAAPGALLFVVGFAAIAARRMASHDRRGMRRRGEQFPVRRRGPPHLRIAP